MAENQAPQQQNLKYIKSAEELLEIKDPEAESNQLGKTLGFGIIFIVALNFIFDSSILYIPQYTAYFSGNASIIGWVLMTFISIYIAMCYGELISMFPTSGGIYEVSKITFGNFTSFLVGWLNWLVGNLGLALAIPAGLEVLIPYEFILGNAILTYIFKAIICISTLYLFSYFAKRGKDIGTKVIFYITIVILLTFAVFIIPMIVDIPALTQGEITSKFNNAYYKPFFLENNTKHNIALIIGSMFIMTTSLFGLSGISYLSGEVKDPQKNLPKVFKWSMIVVAITTLIVAIVSIGIIDNETYINSDSYFYDISLVTLGDISPYIASVLLIIGGLIYFSEGLAWILSGPRLIYSIAKDKLFPTKFAKIDEQYKTPIQAAKFQEKTITIFIIIIYLLYMFSEQLNELDTFYYTLSTFIFLSIILVCLTILAIPVLREKFPEIERPYKVPFGKFLPYIIIGIFLLMIMYWIKHEEYGILVLTTVVILLLLGIPVYFLLVIAFDSDVYNKLKKFITPFSWIYEPFLLSKNVKNEIYSKIGEINDKKIFQYGSIGSNFTIELAEKIGQGKIFVTDTSEKTIAKIYARQQKKNLTNLTAIQDEHQVNRIHPHIPKVDAIISFGMLGHIQDLRKVSKEMAAILPEGGRIVFKEEIDMLKILPNIGWIAQPEKVIEIFKEEGIKINYIKVKRLFWTDLYVYGIKSKYDVPMI